MRKKKKEISKFIYNVQGYTDYVIRKLNLLKN